MFRLLGVLAVCMALLGCAKPQPEMIWVRLDGARTSENPVLAQQFETDRTICLGKMQQANLSGVAVYQGGLYGMIAMQERATAADTVARGCMAERGYELVPLERAEQRRQELAAINAQKQAQLNAPSSKKPK